MASRQDGFIYRHVMNNTYHIVQCQLEMKLDHKSQKLRQLEKNWILDIQKKLLKLSFQGKRAYCKTLLLRSRLSYLHERKRQRGQRQTKRRDKGQTRRLSGMTRRRCSGAGGGEQGGGAMKHLMIWIHERSQCRGFWTLYNMCWRWFVWNCISRNIISCEGYHVFHKSLNFVLLQF